MTARQEQRFQGFSPQTFAFLENIGRHNDKTWFEVHRAEYEERVLCPLRHLVSDLAPFMLTIDLSFEVTPAVGKTISRIYRDTRFSQDKRPFRDSMWIVFKRPGQDWSSYIPGYFLEISPHLCRYGLGFYDAAPKLMARFRQQIDGDPDTFLKATRWLARQDAFTLQGETYKRAVGQDKPDEIRRWYQFKSFYLSCEHPIDDLIMSPQFASRVMKHYGLAAPLYHYLQHLATQVLGEHR
jgi:uncharacterized protein (TIGR02453 family)